VSLLGGIQPGPLRAYIAAAANGGAGDDGLLQRLQLLVWPDGGDEWVNVDRWPDTEAKNRVYDIFKRLDQIRPRIDEGDVPALQFDEAGQEAFNSWREKFERRLRTENMPPAIESHLTKYRSLLPSLALIFHLIDTPERPAVGLEHVRRAEAWLTYLESHARRLYAQVLDPGMAAAIALSERFKDLPDQFTARDVSQRGWAGLDRVAVEKGLDVLVDMLHLSVQTVSTGGRPTKTYSKNPALNFPLSPDEEPSKGSKGAFEGFEGESYGDIGKNLGDILPVDEVEL
jgi:putative DNA primase/helicase